MFRIKSKILKKLGAAFMAGLCAFSMLGSSVSGIITASAANLSTENSALPSADTVIAKAATLLGSPYTFGNKGYWYAYNQGEYTPLSVETINSLGIDCSGLVYYTLTQLGYSTSGFSWNNPVPVDTAHCLFLTSLRSLIARSNFVGEPSLSPLGRFCLGLWFATQFVENCFRSNHVANLCIAQNIPSGDKLLARTIWSERQ